MILMKWNAKTMLFEDGVTEVERSSRPSDTIMIHNTTLHRQRINLQKNKTPSETPQLTSIKFVKGEMSNKQHHLQTALDTYVLVVSTL